MALELFHPIIQKWFLTRFRGPTEPQQQGWPHLAAGKNTLIAAPTGSGKTLTAFLSAIDRLLRRAERGELADAMQVVYVSPLRALSNDMHRNLEVPLAEIHALAEAEGIQFAPLRVGLRTGDTTSSQRAKLLRHPPHILVTTPESLYLLLTSVKGREALRSVETVIVDEIHALVRDKRGSHLALSLERLAALCPRPLQRIGLSATQRPMSRIAEFLVGSPPSSDAAPSSGNPETPEFPSPGSPFHCAIVDVGHQRDLDLAIEVPPSELGAVCMHEQWDEINARLCELIQSHRSTLIFVNNRRLAERLTHQLTELLGEDQVSSHHGSLAAELRLSTEQRLKTGQLKAVVATASLELGLDIGYIDLVVQIASPRSIATFLQRVGRSGHALGLVPKGRLFALTRDELLECMALLRAVRGGRLDVVPIPEAPLDILAQQIVAEVACDEQHSDELFARFRRAYPYRNLLRSDYDLILKILGEGITPEAGRARVYLHYDLVGRRLRARPGARLAACSCGGAIPEIASYRVVAEPERTVVGSLDEEFAAESQAGEIFLLGNTSWRIECVRGGEVTVNDAHGAPPTIPFWRGEAPGRTRELSEEVSRLREELEARIREVPAVEDVPSESGDTALREGRNNGSSALADLSAAGYGAIIRWLMEEGSTSEFAAAQIVKYVAAQQGAMGLVPSQQRVVFERFFDESGGMQLVIHAPFGAQITKAWGLAMRKRFCRSFDFELQASADDDGIVLSLGPQHSFPLESMFPMLHAGNVRNLLEQALLAVPTFQTRWRWNAIRALQVLRHRNGKKVPPNLLRMRADDLLTAVFPKLTGCQENIVGDHEIPDHPLVRQSMHDSLQEAHDLSGLLDVLRRVERGEITFVARDTREPSPFSYELLNANPYAFLDGGEAQERRARAVATRRSLTVESVHDLGRLDPAAILQVRAEAQPWVRNADEWHDVLLSRLAIPVPAVDAKLPLPPSEYVQDTAGQNAPETCPQKTGPLVPPFTEDVARYAEFFSQLVASGRATTVTTATGQEWWVATERLPMVLAMFPGAGVAPPVSVPVEVRADWQPEEARTAAVRSLLEICGPITTRHAAHWLDLTPSQADACLQALEGEGVVLRGRFTPPVAAGGLSFDGQGEASSAGEEQEWCHRRLLSRIHRLTMEGLRKQIEPVSVDVYFRFLARHLGIQKGFQRTGANGVFETIAQLQGWDIPAIAWERDILPARIERYRPEWLDELCLAGEVRWGRLFPPARLPDRSRPLAALTRVVPLSMFLRDDAAWLQSTAVPPDQETLSSPAREVWELLKRHGAMFAADILAATRLLPTHLNDVLGELVSQGLVTADGFAGLRMLLSSRVQESRTAIRQRGGLPRRRILLAGAGRWSLWQREPLAEPGVALSPLEQRVRAEALRERWATQLLRRWGVVFRELLEREEGAPRWYELLPIFRRLEARGEIRGGRFIVGVAGEQFALSDTVKLLRQLRDAGPKQEVVIVSAVDPLNLVGVITSHERIPRMAGNRVAFLDGQPVARLIAQEVEFLGTPSPATRKLLQEGRLLQPGNLLGVCETDTELLPDSSSLKEPVPGSGVSPASEVGAGRESHPGRSPLASPQKPQTPGNLFAPET